MTPCICRLYRHFGDLYCLHLQKKSAISQEALAASIIRAMIALIMEAARTSEILVNFYQTTRRYNPEDSHLLTV
jgi:hypothetical protein